MDIRRLYLKLLMETIAMDRSRLPAVLCLPEFDGNNADADANEIDVGHHYEWLFTQLDKMVKRNELREICTSDEIDEPLEAGDYTYYLVEFIDEWCMAGIYMQPSHPWVFPRRLTFYAQSGRIEMSVETSKIIVYPKNHNVMHLFTQNPDIAGIKEYLRNTDRPRYK
jgi:hypothetical protein